VGSKPLRKTVRKPENAPKRIWMIDLPGGYIEVSNLYLWVKLAPGQKTMQYRIDGKNLYHALQNLNGRKTVGDLDFWGFTVNGEDVVVIEPAEGNAEDEFLFQFEVSLTELSEALYYFLN
jgi:hypothetical protein